MFSSIQSIPGLIFTRSNVKAKIWPGVEARYNLACCTIDFEWVLIGMIVFVKFRRR